MGRLKTYADEKSLINFGDKYIKDYLKRYSAKKEYIKKGKELYLLEKKYVFTAG